MTASAFVSGNDILAFVMGALMRLPQATTHRFNRQVVRDVDAADGPASAQRRYRGALILRATHPQQGQRARFVAIGTGDLVPMDRPFDRDIVIDEWRGDDTSGEAVEAMVHRQLGVMPFAPRFRLSADRDGRLQVHATTETCQLTVFALCVIQRAESKSPEDGPDRGQYRYSLEIGGTLAALYLARMTDPEPF